MYVSVVLKTVYSLRQGSGTYASRLASQMWLFWWRHLARLIFS